MPKLVRIIYVRPRLFISLLVGLAAFLAAPVWWRPATRLLIAWDVFSALYTSLVFAMVARWSIDRIRRQAAIQDDGRFIILIVTAVGALASIAAIILELSIKPQQAAQLALALVTILLSWAMIHITFALHYAHEYYRGGTSGGLAFPGGQDPDYWDFVYFSFVIGMTAQVSDVGITDRMIRRTATAHGVVSFMFNTALLALTVNIAAGVI